MIRQARMVVVDYSVARLVKEMTWIHLEMQSQLHDEKLTLVIADASWLAAPVSWDL